MKATKKLARVGNNFYFSISKEMREYLGIDEDNIEVEWQDDIGKHGAFISFWLKNTEPKESKED